MKVLTKDIQLGMDYAYIDGWVFPTVATHLRFEGIHSRHDLDAMPQAVAILDRRVLDHTLGDKRYWEERRVDRE